MPIVSLWELRLRMQMKIKFNLETADGKPLRSEIFNTIHALNP